ncbi:MAG: replication/maintenance protein RepL [Lachnospiraceae bacterium]|nr:replication/maintenance protein RepL [Lachnospiraceae bacterium]MBQ9199610.1 replication/maintenance protein RepL [Lachnospiraceae bacterium]
MKQTSKKQKLIGIQEYLNPDTGELIPMQVVSVEERDFNFHKVWLQHLVDSLDGISNQKLRLAFWIIENLNKENQLIMTQRIISEKSGMSLDTVSKTMKALQESEPAFLVKINSGAYMVNPNVIWKGSHASRMGVVFDYSAQGQNVSTKNERRQEEPTEPLKQTSNEPYPEYLFPEDFFYAQEPFESDPEYRIKQLHKRIGCITLEDFKYLSYESMGKLETDLNSGKPVGTFIKEYLDEISAFKHFEQEFELEIPEDLGQI